MSVFLADKSYNKVVERVISLRRYYGQEKNKFFDCSIKAEYARLIMKGISNAITDQLILNEHTDAGERVKFLKPKMNGDRGKKPKLEKDDEKKKKK